MSKGQLEYTNIRIVPQGNSFSYKIVQYL